MYSNINYYTVSGRNANIYFDLNLNVYSYYSWDEIKLLGENKFNEYRNNGDNVQADKYHKNLSTFQWVIDSRKKRESDVRREMKNRDIKFIPHSYLVRNYIMYGIGKLDDVVSKMYMMKILFEKCDIVNKWEKYKIDNGQQIYTYDEKDSFYEKQYINYLESMVKL